MSSCCFELLRSTLKAFLTNFHLAVINLWVQNFKNTWRFYQWRSQWKGIFMFRVITINCSTQVFLICFNEPLGSDVHVMSVLLCKWFLRWVVHYRSVHNIHAVCVCVLLVVIQSSQMRLKQCCTSKKFLTICYRLM